nr:hypothetical protein B0A51_11240 [Rachicladosporium sp. CCFEE 5018]
MSLTTTTKVGAPLDFYLPGGEGVESLDIPLLNKNKSLKFDTHQVDIEDARGHKHGYTLDKNGFEFFNVPTTFTDFDNEDAIKTHYLKAIHAYAINHALRSSIASSDPTPKSKLDPPASVIHCDWSYRGAQLCLTEPLLPRPWEAANHSPNTHWAAYSLWRPLVSVTRDALALADKSTVSDEDLQPYITRFATGAVNEGASLRFREGQRFVYWGVMQPGGKGTEEIFVGFPKTNELQFDTRLVEIRDARGGEAEFTLDVQGFEFLRVPTSFTNWDDLGATKEVYYHEVANFMREHLGASHACPINHVLRSSDPFTPGARPAKFLHCDWSYAGALHNLNTNPDYQPPNWETLEQSHSAAYSVWRPLTPVTRDALMLADKRTVPDSDLRLYKSIYPNGTEFWWWSGMQVGEVVVIKLFDSKLDGRARCAPHSAFVGDGDYGVRRSVETRVLVF